MGLFIFLCGMLGKIMDLRACTQGSSIGLKVYFYTLWKTRVDKLNGHRAPGMCLVAWQGAGVSSHFRARSRCSCCYFG